MSRQAVLRCVLAARAPALVRHVVPRLPVLLGAGLARGAPRLGHEGTSKECSPSRRSRRAGRRWPRTGERRSVHGCPAAVVSASSAAGATETDARTPRPLLPMAGRGPRYAAGRARTRGRGSSARTAGGARALGG